MDYLELIARATFPRSQAALDIFYGLDLPSLTMVGRANGQKDGHAVNSAEKQTLIFKSYNCIAFYELICGLQNSISCTAIPAATS